MKSMTGYGSSEASTKEGKVSVEARSENHRFLDIKLQAPDFLNDLEGTVNDLVKKNISRGKIKISINPENHQSRTLTINKKTAEKYYMELAKLRDELNLAGDITIDHILMFKEVFNGNNESSVNKTTFRKIRTAVKRAISNLEKSRKTEGRKLQNDLAKRTRKCTTLLNKIKNKRSVFTEENAQRIKERVENLLGDHQIDTQRLYQEVAILCERTDITEEIVRLESHIDQFTNTSRKKGPIGKELDFLILEMNREASTISAKSKDADVSHFTINLRSEFEKMREQVQNIE